jgi:hypothetical protein
MNRFNRRLIGLALLLVGLGLGWYLLFVRSKPRERVVILPFPVQQSASPRLLGLAKVLVWRVKAMLSGNLHLITLEGSAIGLHSPSGYIDFSMPQAEYAGTNGIQVWSLSNDTLADLVIRLGRSDRAEMLSRIGMQTADRMEGSAFNAQSMLIGSNNLPVGISWDVMPRHFKDSIDLTSTVSITEAVTNNTDGTVVSVRTNLAVAARVLIPYGSGLVILNTNTATMFVISVKRPGR